MSRGRWLAAIRWTYLVLLAAGVAWLVWTRRAELAELATGARLPLLGLALVLAFGQLALNALFWSAALRALGERRSWGEMLGVASRSLPARYLPGALWYTLGRVGMLRHRGVPGRTLGVVAALEAVLSLTVAFGLGTGLLLASGRLPGRGWLLVWGFGVAVLVSPPVVNRVLRWVALRRGGEVGRLRWGAYLGLLGLAAVFWAWSATTFAVYLWAFPSVDPGPYPVVAGTYMVAWGIGFLVPFAPQGLGVFEAAASALLADPRLGGVAVVVGGYRLVMVVRDGVAAVSAELFSLVSARITAGRRPTERH